MANKKKKSIEARIHPTLRNDYILIDKSGEALSADQLNYIFSGEKRSLMEILKLGLAAKNQINDEENSK